jgi:hypothetical protein
MQKLICKKLNIKVTGFGESFLIVARTYLSKYISEYEEVLYFDKNKNEVKLRLFWDGELQDEDGRIVYPEIHEENYYISKVEEKTILTIK